MDMSWFSRPRQASRIVILLLATSGCTTFTAQLKPSPPDSITTQTVPIDVGVYFSSDVREYVARYSWSDGIGPSEEVYLFPMGDATVDLFHGVTQRIFRSSSLINRPPGAAQAGIVQNVLQIDIGRVDIFHGRPIPNPSTAEVTYKIKAYDKHGEIVTKWTVMGTAEVKGELVFSLPPPHLIKAVELAMRDAANKFASSFQELPEAREWLDAAQQP